MKPAIASFVTLFWAITGGGSVEYNVTKRAWVIGIDGARGDAIEFLFANNSLPNLAWLATNGVHAPCHDAAENSCARAHTGPLTDPSYKWVTAAGWASVITGMDSLHHGVRDNMLPSDLEFMKYTKNHPTMFMSAKRAGLVTAAVGVPNFLSAGGASFTDLHYGVTDFEDGCAGLTSIGTTSSCNLDHRLGIMQNDSNPYTDNRQVRFALERLDAGDTDLLMTHLDLVDERGHDTGWPPAHIPPGLDIGYLRQLEVVDEQVGRILDAVRERVATQGEEWLVVVTSDHGGSDHQHGHDQPYDNAIPFIVATVPARPLDGLKQPVYQFDTTPTVLAWLSVPFDDLDGKVQGFPPPPPPTYNPTHQPTHTDAPPKLGDPDHQGFEPGGVIVGITIVILVAPIGLAGLWYWRKTRLNVDGAVQVVVEHSRLGEEDKDGAQDSTSCSASEIGLEDEETVCLTSEKSDSQPTEKPQE